MPRTQRTRGSQRRLVWTGTVIALLAIAGAWVMAASFSINQGATENGSGMYHATNAISYWSEASVGVGTQPSTLPSTLSTNVGSPTTLAASGTNYAINTPTSNDIAHFWKFTEATSAPATTELELQFTVSTGAVPVITQIIVYVETQVTIPATAQTFALYYDLGSASSGTITLNAVTEISQACSGVGTCP